LAIPINRAAIFDQSKAELLREIRDRLVVIADHERDVS
jgi:hypothetical protein